MQSRMLKSERRVLLSTGVAGSRERHLALAAVLISGVMFLATVLFVKRQLPAVPSFIPAYEAALVLSDLITAVLLFGQYNFLRSRALLVIASGYLFTALIAFLHALTFPGVFSTTGLLNAGSQTTASLYMLWHGGFPLFVIAYALLQDVSRDEFGKSREAPAARGGGRTAIFAAIAAVTVVVFGLVLLTTAGHDILPLLVLDSRFTPAMTIIVWGVWMLSVVALVVLWLRRPHTVLDLWLMVVMCAWLFDIALSAGLNGGRFDVGWYAGRLYGLLAASCLLIVLMIENATYFARLVELSEKLAVANDSLEYLSLHDGMTDLANRRLFDKYLARQLAVARRYSRPLALVMCDVDHFKAYNDHYGHQAGDECLKQIAAAIESCCRRPADMAVRYGGEEFAMILPETGLIGAVQIAEAAREAVAKLGLRHAHSAAATIVSISGGVSVLSHDYADTVKQLIETADQNLYRAKHLGRDRIVSVQAKAA